jgi:60 kDa SS-A/Ro ribonucleoprotein
LKNEYFVYYGLRVILYIFKMSKNITKSVLKNMLGPGPKTTKPTEVIPGREDEMTDNRGGGIGFKVSDDDLTTRYAILGTGSGYYTTGKSNTTEMVNEILRMVQEGNGFNVLKVVSAVYKDGRAKSQTPVLTMLAILCRSEDLELRKASWLVVTELRTQSHLLEFIDLYKNCGKTSGWGSLPKRMINTWITNKGARDLLYQAFKYLSRNGWTLRDVMRKSHIKPTSLSPDKQVVLKAIASYGGKTVKEDTVDTEEQSYRDLTTAEAFDRAVTFAKGLKESDHTIDDEIVSYIEAIGFLKGCTECNPELVDKIVELVYDHNMTFEFLPSWARSNKKVIRSLLLSKDGKTVRTPMMALIRNLGIWTSHRVFNKSDEGDSLDEDLVNLVVQKLTNIEVIKRARIHMAALLIAYKQYKTGRGLKGKTTWVPIPQLVRALHDAAMVAGTNSVPFNGPTEFDIDASGSMTTPMGVLPCMNSAEAAACLVLPVFKTMKTDEAKVFLFSSAGCKDKPKSSRYSYYSSYDRVGLYPAHFDKTMGFEAATKATQRSDWSTTDISLPIEERLSDFKKAFKRLAKSDQQKYTFARQINDQLVMNEIRSRMYDENDSLLWLPHNFVFVTDNDVNTGKRHPSQALHEYRQVTGIPARMAVIATQSSRTTVADPKDNGQMDFVGFDGQLPRFLTDFLNGDLSSHKVLKNVKVDVKDDFVPTTTEENKEDSTDTVSGTDADVGETTETQKSWFPKLW